MREIEQIEPMEESTTKERKKRRGKEEDKKEDEEKSGEISSGGRAGAGKGRPSPVVFVFCDLLLF